MKKILAYFSRFLRPSLRFEVALVFVLPVFLLIAIISYDHYLGEWRALENQIRLTAIQLGDIVLGSLRHSMLKNDASMIDGVLSDIDKKGDIERIWIVDLNGDIKRSTQPTDIGRTLSKNMVGCVECHQYAPASRPKVVETSQSLGTMRIAAPINNSPDCQVCHSPLDKHLGVLLIDTSMTDLRLQLQNDLRRSLLLAGFMALAGMGLVLSLVNWFFLRRVETIHHALRAFEAGDFSARIKNTWKTEDELAQLGASFNSMVDSIVDHEKRQYQLTMVRQQAIIEERERIARELHDGVAQFIGYVNTKLSAARMLLSKEKVEKADEYLAQIAQAVQDQSLDVRSSILGLRLVSHSGVGLVLSLREYIDQCNRISDFAIELDADPQLDSRSLGAEIELQLVRVVQEALSNVRKHACARQALVRCWLQDGELLVSIHDDGIGFNPWAWSRDQQAHFGLQTMRERAEAVGAMFLIESEPGHGTTVTVRLKLDQEA